MSSSLMDPLDRTDKMRYCSACGNSSATYAGKFMAVPVKPETRIEWLVRMGVMKRNEPLPRSKMFYICDDHFDKERDFIQTSNGIRHRPHTLPWKNLKTGTYTYHGCEELLQPTSPRSCGCVCCQRPKSPPLLGPTVTIQTDDVEYIDGAVVDQPIRNFIPEKLCRLCLRGVRATSGHWWRLFCKQSRQPTDPELLERIYVTTGLMLHWNREPGALICADCAQQTEQAYRFRLQSRSNHRTYLASIPAKKRKALYPEYVYPKSRIPIGDDEEEEPIETRDIEQIHFVPAEQVEIKVEPDLPPESPKGGASKRPKRDPTPTVNNESCPVGLMEFKLEFEPVEVGGRTDDIKVEPDLPPESTEDGAGQRTKRDPPVVIESCPVGQKEVKLEFEPVEVDGQVVSDGRPPRIKKVDFEEFKKMLSKIKAEKES